MNLQSIGIGFGLIGSVATFLPLLRATQWWVRIFDFPRVQILFVLAVGISLIGAALVFQPVSLVVLLMLAVFFTAAGIQIWKMVPYSRLVDVQVPEAEPVPGSSSLRLMVSNLLQHNTKHQRFLDLVHRIQPDILFVVECNLRWVEALDPLREHYPHSCLHPLDNEYGLALYSRLPLSSLELRFLRKEDIPSVRFTVELESGQRVLCFGVHPAPPVPQYAVETDQRDAELLTVAFEARQLDEPMVVFGDLNDVAWSPTTTLFQAVSRLRDPRVGRGQFNTYHAGVPLFRYPLDHIFVSNHFRLRELHVLPSIGSDHFPILAELELPPKGRKAAKREGEAPESSPEDLEAAEERLEEADRKLEEEEVERGVGGGELPAPITGAAGGRGQ